MTGGPRLALAAIPARTSAVTYVRFVQPFARLAERGWSLVNLGESLRLARTPRGWEPDPSILDGVSLLLFPQMVLAPVLPDGARARVVEPLCEEARRRGIPVVYVVDDWLPALDPRNPAFDAIEDSKANLEAMLERADAVIATTEPFRRSLAPWGKPVHVVPNAVDPDHWKLRPRKGEGLRVGWSGSASHLDDLLVVAPALSKLEARVPFRFVLQGLSDEPLLEQAKGVKRALRDLRGPARERAEAFLELVSVLRPIDFEHVPFVPVERFFDLLPSLDLDLGLCPLRDTEFNRHRSANKFYEYAVTGTATVASDVTPYRGEVSLLAGEDPASWIEILEPLLRDSGARDRSLEAQRAFVLGERSLGKVANRWAETLEEILRRAPA